MTALDEDVMIDVSLDDAIPCANEGCEQEAQWRIASVHDHDGKRCGSVMACDRHLQIEIAHERQVRAEGQHVVCVWHPRVPSHLIFSEL